MGHNKLMSLQGVYIHTFGCQMNVYDSSRMADLLAISHQLERTDDPGSAQVLLINTCSVREKAQEKVFSMLGRFRLLKEKDPEVIIGVGGCVASQEGEEILRRAPFVDLVFGPQTIHRLPDMISEVRKSRVPAVDLTFPEIEKFDHLPQPRSDGPVAFVSIMEGCSKYCSFCIVPYTRGEEVSRPVQDILAEVEHLAQQGVREITLLGQNVNAYRGLFDDGVESDLALLIHYVSALDGIERIRFTTSHPAEFTDELIAAFAEVPELASHVHLPVQSGSDRILADMKRGYTIEQYKRIIAALRKVRPDVTLSSDFIVGYPGETENDFQATMDLVDALNFPQSFSFAYSQRPGTPAADLPNQVPEDVKKERLRRLQTLLNAQAERARMDLDGFEEKVLVEKKGQYSHQLSGRTSGNQWVHFSGEPSWAGEFIKVRIDEVLPHCLRGQACSSRIDPPHEIQFSSKQLYRG